MKLLLVDDDPMGLTGFELECGQMKDITIAGSFTSPLEAMAFAQDHPIDVALLDIDMPEMDGFTLFDHLKAIRPEMIAIFVTCHDAYAAAAMRRKADYIVFKPYDHEEVEDVFERIRLLQGRLNKALRCRTFDRFDVFMGTQPVVFRSAKAKELLALCVSRCGAPVSCGEIIDLLWPNYVGTVGECSIFRYTVKQLVDTLTQAGAADVFIHERSQCRVQVDRIRCDYIQALAGDPEALDAFHGCLMQEYDWAESLIYPLRQKKRGSSRN